MAEAQPTKKPGGSGSDTGQTSTGGGPYYAWNTFTTGWDEHGIPTTKIKPGDPVTQADLDVSDEEWESLVETGAVSEEEYPDIPSHVSPAEYAQQLDVHDAMQDVVDTHQELLDAALDPDAPGPQPKADADAPVAMHTKASTASKSTS